MRFESTTQKPARAAMVYLSLDVEASGPFPGLFSLLSIGAVPVILDRKRRHWHIDASRQFYVELKPLPEAAELEAATQVHGLTRAYLAEHGAEPELAMQEFQAYFAALRGRDHVTGAAWPASFDLPYVGYYCQRFLGSNPLGWSGFDIASYGMGLFRCRRKELRTFLQRHQIVSSPNPKPHHALHDAVEQGELLAGLLNHAQALRQADGKPTA